MRFGYLHPPSPHMVIFAQLIRVMIEFGRKITFSIDLSCGLKD
ncbi:MAG: hypothetical protein SBU_000693 [Candidatus Syntrophoarchaeum butanivorans]|uniref:Uncharacterized protein n=1 Tax=Candidatus Syntropharchaeum butanivorans TaxID=1839936 RepID=A0A1F2P608_9EURY|nr:MAG: hypothetical protein SBU_000693 [Candidatus Syntrophoarchaeum butanivorans]